MSVLPDQRCVELAKHFLPHSSDDRVWRLALALQEVVEEFPEVPDGKPMTLEEQATANVLAVRGSHDAPGFDYCVEAELRRLKQVDNGKHF